MTASVAFGERTGKRHAEERTETKAEKKKAESEFVEQKSIADEGDQRCPCGNRKAARKKGDACCQNLTLEREALRTASDAPRGSGRCEDGGGGL